MSLWQFLWSSIVLVILLHTGWSARLRDTAARMTRARWLQPAIYGAGFLLITSVLGFPLSLFTDFWREHQYGLATQTFAAWFGDQMKGLGIGLVLGSVMILVLYAVLRMTGRAWWIWGAVVTMAFMAFVATIGPVYLAPIFNTYKPLENHAIREPILRIAHANGIAASEVWEVDASRQSTRISANVSGMFGTQRITLNDNLLKRASPAAVEAVMGHEMGHYVLNHVYEMLAYFAVIITIGFAVTSWAFARLAERYRQRWGVEGVTDPAGLPIVALVLGVYLFAMTPVLNTIVRTNEYEADMFGTQRRPATRRFCRSGAAARRLSEAGPVTGRGNDLLRPSERTDTDPRRHAMEGQSAAVAAAIDQLALERATNGLCAACG